MALKGTASFDVYGTSNITDQFVSCGPGAIVPGAGRCGSAAFHGTTAGGSGPSIGVTTSEISGYAGFAYNPDGFNVTNTFSLGSTGVGAASIWAFLRVNDNGSIALWKGVNYLIGTQLAVTPAGLLSTSHYTHIGWEFKQGTSGYMRVYVNKQLVADTGIVNMLAVFTDGLPFGRIDWTPLGYIDDLYWGDTDASDPLNPWVSILQIGDQHVEGQLPLTDAVGGGGTFRDFACSTGTDHGALLDENPPNGDTDYVSSSTLNARESVRYPIIIPTTGGVTSIQHMPNLLKTTFADRLIANGVYSHGALSLGVDQAPAQTNYKYYPQLFAANPVIAAPWSIADTNAEEAVLKITG